MQLQFEFGTNRNYQKERVCNAVIKSETSFVEMIRKSHHLKARTKIDKRSLWRLFRHLPACCVLPSAIYRNANITRCQYKRSIFFSIRYFSKIEQSLRCLDIIRFYCLFNFLFQQISIHGISTFNNNIFV